MNIFNQKPKSLTQRKNQTGKSDYQRDKTRLAMPSGKRLSKNNKIYYEGRKNRSDLKNKI